MALPMAPLDEHREVDVANIRRLLCLVCWRRPDDFGGEYPLPPCAPRGSASSPRRRGSLAGAAGESFEQPFKPRHAPAKVRYVAMQVHRNPMMAISSGDMSGSVRDSVSESLSQSLDVL